MVFAESIARWLLVAHTAAAVACVGVSTHLALWLRSWRRGRHNRVRAVRRFAILTAGLYALTLVIGNLLYPTYKVRVRAELLDNPSEITREAEARARAARRVETLYGPGAREVELAPPTEGPARRGAKMARWFDVKEHWVVFGGILSLAIALIVTGWDPRADPEAPLGPLLFWMAVGSAGAAWLAAIIGVVVSSYRAVGGL